MVCLRFCGFTSTLEHNSSHDHVMYFNWPLPLQLGWSTYDLLCNHTGLSDHFINFHINESHILATAFLADKLLGIVCTDWTAPLQLG